MASAAHAAYIALAALTFWTVLGYPFARRIVESGLALAFAPLVGWAIYSVTSLLLFFFFPFRPDTAAALAVAWIVGTLLWQRLQRPGRTATAPLPTGAAALFARSGPRGAAWRIPPLAWPAALIVAVVIAAAIAPKHAGDAVLLSDPIFDHAKVAIIDDMARQGLPPGNPFFAHDGLGGKLAYYYLWHFSAASVAQTLGGTGWEADIAMTFFSAFTSLAVMMALAVRISARPGAALAVVILALSSSSRLVLEWLAGHARLEAWLPAPGGFGGWLFQSSWVPQHVAGTSCVLTSFYLMSRMASQPRYFTGAVLALLVAAGFETSTWVGGVVFAFAWIIAVPVLALGLDAARRRTFVVSMAASAVAALCLAAPFIRDELLAAAHRQSRFPIALHVFEVAGAALPEGLRGLADAPLFWLVLLPVELTAAYVAGMPVWLRALRARASDAATQPTVRALWAVAGAALAAAWLFVSTLADNNDLGWRADLLACTALIIFGAAGLAFWVEQRRWLPLAIIAGALALGLPESGRQALLNFTGEAEPDATQFAEAPALWQAVRAHTAVGERVANNPSAFQDMTPWPVNIGWSLLAERRSCYAGWELTQVYTSVPHDQLYLVDVQFKRVFAGAAEPDDVRQLAQIYDCAVAVVTPADGAWSHDPFEHSPWYGLVAAEPGRWRIYRRRAAPP